MEWQITNARLVLPGGKEQAGGVHIVDGRFAAVLGGAESIPELTNLNLHGLTVVPGLVNAYDALAATFHAFDGIGRPYRNWLEWDNELKSSALFKERMLLELEDLYRLGAYRNLVSGVTTVLDHVPHFMRRAAPEDLPVDLLADFGLAHSIGRGSLGWGEGPGPEYARAAEAGLPFVTRIAEGSDTDSSTAVATLAAAGALGEHTVLARGFGLSAADLDRIAAAGASLIWCPESDDYLYERTLPIGPALERGINVMLGTDSAMSGCRTQLSNLAAALAAAARDETEIAPRDLFLMVTENAARGLRLPRTARIEKGARSDLAVLSASVSGDACLALCRATPADIYLVVRDGRPVFGDADLAPIFTQAGIVFDRIELGGREKIIVHGLKKLLESLSTALGYNREFAFLAPAP